MIQPRVMRIDVSVTDGAQRLVRSDSQKLLLPGGGPPLPVLCDGKPAGSRHAAEQQSWNEAWAAVPGTAATPTTHESFLAVPAGNAPAETAPVDPSARRATVAANSVQPGVSGGDGRHAGLPKDGHAQRETTPPALQPSQLADALGKLVRLLDELHRQSLQAQRQTHTTHTTA